MAWFAPSASASASGLQYKLWYTSGVPTMPRTSTPDCTGITETLDINFHVTPLCNRSNLMTVEFTGYITPDVNIDYLYLQSDDGNQLYMDNEIVSNAWYPSGNAGSPIAYSMQAGQTYPIKVNFFESGGGSWIRLNYYDPTVGYIPVPNSWLSQTEPTPTTTTLTPYLNAPQSLTATNTTDGVVLDWDAPTASNTDIGSYTINFWDLDEIGGTVSGGWGIWTPSSNTSFTMDYTLFTGSNPVTTGYGPVRFCIKASNWDGSATSSLADSECVYIDLDVQVPVPPTTTTSSTTTTTTLPLIPSNNGCGPYRAFTVTGTTGGTVWGSGPYTDDSAFGAVAVHAGLIEVGETAVIEPYAVDAYSMYKGTQKNGVYTNDYDSGWCGFFVKLLGTPTPSTSTTSTSLVPTTTTSTIVISPPNNTTNTETENTTVSIPDLDPTPVSTPEPEAVTPVSPTTTTLIETIFDTPVEVTPIETPTSEGNTEGDGPATSVPQYAPEQETTTQTDEPPIVVPEKVQDAADAAVADIFDGPMSNTGLANAVDDLVADAGTPEELTAVVNSLLDQELTDTQFATVIDSVFSEPLSDENFAAAVDAVFADPTKLSDAQFEDAVTAVFDAPLSDAQFEDAVTAVFKDTKSLSDEQFDTAVQAVFDEPLTTEQFSAALDAVFDEPISDEKFDAIIGAVLDEPISNEQFEELVNVLESETVTEDQVAAAVDSVIENGVTEDQATDLATSEKVLQSIDGDQATEIFAAVEISNVTPEEAAQLVAAVQSAPTEVRAAMEEEINVFQGAIDSYVPLDSKVPISGRRVVVAATGIIVVAPRRRIR